MFAFYGSCFLLVYFNLVNITKAAAFAKNDILMVALLSFIFQILMYKLCLFIINVADCICWSATAKKIQSKK